MTRHLTRRQFVRQAAAAGTLAATATLPRVWAAAEKSPNDKLAIAVIGCGGRGAADLKGVQKENIVALCDVDEQQAGRAAKLFPKARIFRDFRKLFDAIHGQIDAAVVATPDHTHAAATAMALHLGKHCYCEKPLARTVHETRTVTELARKNRLVTQMGTQIHAGTNYRRVVELVQSGTIGPVREVHVWHGGARGGLERPTDTPPVPANLDWDLWLGPSPYRPYHPCYAPKNWRDWWDFGNGTLGDFGCHYMDLAFWALGLGHAETIEAEGSPAHLESAPPRLTVHYRFPAREKSPAVRLTWYNGKENRPAILSREKLPAWTAGVLFVGDKGLLEADYTRRRLFPEAKFAGLQPPVPTIPDSVGHHQEWIDACKTGGTTTCHFGYSGVLAEAVLLGSVAYRAGETLRWDAAALRAINCPAAEEFLRAEYRKGWTL